MKNFTKILSLFLALTMLLCFPVAVSAAELEDAPIDESRTGSLTIYKYGLTNAEKDGVWDSSYVSTGVFDQAGVNDVLGGSSSTLGNGETGYGYAIKGVEFSYLKVADIVTFSESENDSRTDSHVEILYAIDKAKGADFLKALNLADGAQRYINADALDETKYFYQSDVLIDALAAALESNSTVVKNALESVPEAVPPLAPPKEQEPDYRLPLPDPTITPDMAEQCGYTIPDMYPLSKDRAMELLEKDVVIFTLYPDKPAEMVFDAEDIVNHDGIFGITCEDWQNIHDTIPTRDVHRRFLETPGDAYAVMQLKGSASAELRYTGLNYLSQPPSPGNYDILYTGPIACAQNQSATLENLFEIFNINRPGDFTGHSLSVSDIIALKQDGVVSYHYCDNVGFQELPGFMSENYLKAAEMSTEDDYGMIDGIINNGQKPTVSDLEQQVKNGQSISLMDLAGAVQREKKPSVLKKLKEQPPQSASERKPQKNKEKEI